MQNAQDFAAELAVDDRPPRDKGERVALRDDPGARTFLSAIARAAAGIVRLP